MRMIAAAFAFLLCLTSAALADDGASLLREARQEARQGRPDFAYLKYRSALRAGIPRLEKKEAYFAVAEYQFVKEGAAAAENAFRQVAREAPNSLEALLALAFLAKTAQASGQGAEEAEMRLKDALSSRPLLLVFDDRKTLRWVSPLGHRFELREYVDQMDILLDGSPFHQIRLP